MAVAERSQLRAYSTDGGMWRAHIHERRFPTLGALNK